MPIPIIAVGAGAVALAGWILEGCGGEKEEGKEKPPNLSKDPPVCTGEKTYDGWKFVRCENSKTVFFDQSDCFIPPAHDPSTYHIVGKISCHPEKFIQDLQPSDYAEMCTSYNDSTLNDAESMALCRTAQLFVNWEFLEKYSKYANTPCGVNSSEEFDLVYKLATGSFDDDFTMCYEWTIESGESVYYCAKAGLWAYEHMCYTGAWEYFNGELIREYYQEDGVQKSHELCLVPEGCGKTVMDPITAKTTYITYDYLDWKDSIVDAHGCPSYPDSTCSIVKKIVLADGLIINESIDFSIDSPTWPFEFTISSLTVTIERDLSIDRNSSRNLRYPFSR